MSNECPSRVRSMSDLIYRLHTTDYILLIKTVRKTVRKTVGGF